MTCKIFLRSTEARGFCSLIFHCKELRTKISRLRICSSLRVRVREVKLEWRMCLPSRKLTEIVWVSGHIDEFFLRHIPIHTGLAHANLQAILLILLASSVTLLLAIAGSICLLLSLRVQCEWGTINHFTFAAADLHHRRGCWRLLLQDLHVEWGWTPVDHEVDSVLHISQYLRHTAT